MNDPDILAVANWLQARHGLYVFPVDHPGRESCGASHRGCDGQRGKHPRGRWPRVATLDPRHIRAMLADGPWNLGIACKPSQLLVVDEDQPGAFAEFAESVGHVPGATFTVGTAKGRHYYYRQDEGAPLGNGRGALAGHCIDIRGGGAGNGGYVVAPGSVHQTGVYYTPVDPTAPILPVPEWLARACSAVPQIQPPTSCHPPRHPASTFTALHGLVRFILGGIPGRDRNNRLYWAACRAAEMVAADLVDQASAEAVLVDAALKAGLHGGEPEARRTVASGMRAAASRGVRHD